MVRAASALRAALVAGALLVTPTLAGEAEIAYLHSLAGDWTGTGNVSGPDGGKVACRIVMKAAGDRVNFSGRCNAPGDAGAQSFSGSIRYSDQRRRYESSSSGITVIGDLKGATLTFVTAQKTIQGDINSTMTVSPRALKMQFHVTDTKGRTYQGAIPFSRS